jgi:hypothetical protein
MARRPSTDLALSEPGQIAPTFWEPDPDLEGILRKGISNSDDFRRATGLLVLEVGSGRLTVGRADIVAKYLKLISDTLIGPAPVTTNIFAQIQQIANQGVPMDRPLPEHAPIDLIAENEATSSWSVPDQEPEPIVLHGKRAVGADADTW